MVMHHGLILENIKREAVVKAAGRRLSLDDCRRGHGESKA
jgi:hypothetical protein